MSEADYGVQLSDTEGYSYFINECLQYGTPVIATNFDSVYESVEDGVNGYILDMKLSNLDIDKIVNNVPKNFTYKPKATVNNWIKIIGEPKKEGCYKKTETIEVEVKKRYHDLQLDRVINQGEKIIVSPERYKILKNKKII